MMTIAQYIDNINGRYKLGNATEHTFRSAHRDGKTDEGSGQGRD